MESRIINMKRKRSSNTNAQTKDLCGSFLVNVLDLSKILNGKNKSKTVHKLTCLKELLDLSPVSGSSSSATTSTEEDTIVISDSESEGQLMANEVNAMDSEVMPEENEAKIKKETLFDHKKVSRFKKLKRRSSSCSDNEDSDEENDISKIKNYVKESLLKGLAINSHKFSNDTLPSTHVKEEPVELIGKDEITDQDEHCDKRNECDKEQDKDCTKETLVAEESKEITNVSVKRKRIRLTKRRHSSYQGKRLLRYYRNLNKKRPKLEKLISGPRITTVTEHEEDTISKEEPEMENDISAVISLPVEQETKETAVQVEETIAPEISVEETLPSSTTNEQDILTLSRLEELKVQITEDETTVYITILDGTTTIPDVLQVLRCTTPSETTELSKSLSEFDEVVKSSVVSEEVNPYFSQNEYKSCYTNASSTTGTNVKALYEIITYPEVKKNLIHSLGSSNLSNKKSQKAETAYSYKTINDSVYTLAPTNCNYINHVHWTNTYPLSFVTNVESHKHLCVLKDLYGRNIQEQHHLSIQPIDMRCNSDHLPKVQYQNEMPKSSMDNSYPFVPPVTTSFFPYQYHQKPHSPQRYNISSGASTSTMRRNAMPLAQPVDVSYARKYMDQKQQTSCRYPQYKTHYPTNNDHLQWKPPRSYAPSFQTQAQSLSFIDIPIHSPTYNIKIPPLRIPITAITPQTHSVSPSSSLFNKPSPPIPYFNKNNFKNYYSSNSRYDYPSQSSNIMKNLLQMEPKSRFVWS